MGTGASVLLCADARNCAHHRGSSRRPVLIEAIARLYSPPSFHNLHISRGFRAVKMAFELDCLLLSDFLFTRCPVKL